MLAKLQIPRNRVKNSAIAQSEEMPVEAGFNKYQMNRSAKAWLLLMMVPFFVGVLIHFLVPLQIIVAANPKLENAYNGYKIEVEQNTVRALAFLNSRVITNRLQMYENIRSTFIRLLQRQDMTHHIDLGAVFLNSARELANSTGEQVELNHSMWYSPNASSVVGMDETEARIFNAYLEAQPFIQSIYSSHDEIYSGLVDLSLTVNHQDRQFYFQYPSTVTPAFLDGNVSALNDFHTNSTLNYNEGFLLTVYDLGKIMRICAVFELWGSGMMDAVVCLGFNISIIINDITSVLGDPYFDLSTNNYYLVRPLFKFENLSWPQIIANFSSTDTALVDIPTSRFFSLEENPLPANIFSGRVDYSLNIQRHQKTNTYYTIPILTSNYDDSSQIAMYLVVLNNFAKAQLAEESRNQRIAIIMIVPSVLLLLLSIAVTTLILRSILRRLDEALCLMGEYCGLIKRGDLELEIPEYTDTEDLRSLFVQLQRLNQLNKYADMSYFNVPKPERIIRFLKCLQLFNDLGYDKTNLYENIAECYVDIGELPNAIKFLRDSTQMTIRELYGDEKQIDSIYEAKVTGRSRMARIPKKKEKIVKRKILRLCNLLHMSYRQGNKDMQGEIVKNAEMLRKICYPDILNFEYIGCLFFILSCKINSGDLSQVHDKMDILYDLVRGYQEVNEQADTSMVPPDVMYSYWYSLAASLKLQEGKSLEAFQLLVKALQGNRFNPTIHQGIHLLIQRILQAHGISKAEMSRFKHMEQYKPRAEREYIYLIDVGKPQMSVHEINEWKKQARRMAEHIFTRLTREDDRVSITEYCHDIKIVCNLMEKQNRDKILRRELMGAFKARDQNITGLVLPCLSKTIERVRNLKKQKVFLVFLKNGVAINGSEIQEQIRDVENAKFIFFVQDIESVADKNESFYAIEYGNECDVDRVLEEKVWRQADNIVYIL